MARSRSAAQASAITTDFKAQLWASADQLRGNIESAEYKHVVLGLIFLKFVSDAFEERRAELLKEAADDPDAGIDPDDKEEYTAKAVFYLPEKARWSYLRENAASLEIGVKVDAAMKLVEDANPKRLRGVLPRDYARPALDKTRLGQVINLLSNVGVGGKEHQSKDTLGEVYMYFLGHFASAEGRRGGEFYTPKGVVQLLVEMLEPRANTRIYDPCCGSGGMFVQSERFIEEHGGKRLSASVYGQELNHTTWRLCRMNLAIRGIEAEVVEGDSLLRPAHRDERFDFVISNPPFNMSVWGAAGVADDARWAYGTPPAGNANYAWIQHFVHHLKPDGFAGFVMANGSLSSNTSGEGDIRRAIVQADLVDCVVALPGQLFLTAQIPVCLWFLARSKTGDRYRKRAGETLFIDARKGFGTLVNRTLRELSADEIGRIARTYHAWRGEKGAGDYADVPGFCKAARTADIEGHGWVLTPGRYVGAADAEEDDEPFEDKMARLIGELKEQLAESKRLDAAIRANLGKLGYTL